MRFEFVVERRPERVVMFPAFVAIADVFPATTPERELKFVVRSERFEFVVTRAPERDEISEKSVAMLEVLVAISAVTPERLLLMVAIVPESAFCARRSVK